MAPLSVLTRDNWGLCFHIDVDQTSNVSVHRACHLWCASKTQCLGAFLCINTGILSLLLFSPTSLPIWLHPGPTSAQPSTSGKLCLPATQSGSLSFVTGETFPSHRFFASITPSTLSSYHFPWLHIICLPVYLINASLPYQTQSQCHPIELSVVVEIFYICTLQCNGHQPCVAVERLKSG